MEVGLKLHWGLEKYLLALPVEGGRLSLPEGSSAGELLEQLGIPTGEVGMIVVNGSMTQKDHSLRDRDEVQVYPMLGGG